MLAVPVMGVSATEEERRVWREMGERVQQLCEAVELADGVTETQVRKACGVNYDAWKSYLKGARKFPLTVLIKLSRDYGAEIAWLVAGDAKHNDPVFQAKLYKLADAPKVNKPKRGRPPKR